MQNTFLVLALALAICTFAHWYIGTFAHLHIGTLVHLHIGTSAHWYICTLNLHFFRHVDAEQAHGPANAMRHEAGKMKPERTDLFIRFI